MKLSDQDIEAIARRIAADLGAKPAPAPAAPAGASAPQPGMGVFAQVGEAVAAAQQAFQALNALPLDTRKKIVAAIRHTNGTE